MPINPILYTVLSSIVFLLFIWKFIHYRYPYLLVLLIWIPTTWITTWTDKWDAPLGILQAVLFIVCIYFIFRRQGQQLRATRKRLNELAEGKEEPSEGIDGEQPPSLDA